MLATPCPANKNVGNCNSFAKALCKEIETPKLPVHDVVYKSPCKFFPLLKAPERKKTRKIRKGRSLILTDTPEEKRLEKEAKEKAEGFLKKILKNILSKDTIRIKVKTLQTDISQTATSVMTYMTKIIFAAFQRHLDKQ